MCARGDNCRYLHASRAEEEIYKTSGEVPQRLLDEAFDKGLDTELQGQTPLCKDYLNGICTRGQKCRYTHSQQQQSSSDQRQEAVRSRSPTPIAEPAVVLAGGAFRSSGLIGAQQSNRMPVAAAIRAPLGSAQFGVKRRRGYSPNAADAAATPQAPPIVGSFVDGGFALHPVAAAAELQHEQRVMIQEENELLRRR